MKTYQHIAPNRRLVFVSDFSFVGSTVLRGKNIIAIYRDGIGISKIKTSGTPTAKEAVYITLTGGVILAGSSEPGVVTRILYQNATGES